MKLSARRRFDARERTGLVQKRLQIIQELLNGDARMRVGALLVGWGFTAVMALLVAVSAYQNRLPDPFRAQYAAYPLPEAGEIETTASIGDAQKTGRFGVFTGLGGQKGGLPERVDAELETLRQEIIALRRSADALRRQNEVVSNRLAMLEADVPRPDAGLGRPSETRTLATRPTLVVPPPAASQRGGSLGMAADGSDPITTGSIAKPADGMAGAAVAPRSEFGIDLGSYASLADVASAWQAMRVTESAIIGKLSPLAAVTEKAGTMSAHLVAGPFSNAADAAAACARLSKRRIDCTPTLYAGQPLSSM